MFQVDDIFKSGSLNLPESMPELHPSEILWGDILSNRILIGVSVLLMVVSMVEILRFFPTAIYCVKRARGSVNLEHSVSQARTRNLLALVHALPLCLVVDKYDIYRIQMIPQEWSALSLLGVIAAFLLVRRLLYLIIMPRRKARAEFAVAAHRAIYTFAIVMTWVVLTTDGVMYILGSDWGTVRKVILWELAVLYALDVIRTGQILGGECTGISTFLYLCGFEIIPAALLVASTFYV